MIGEKIGNYRIVRLIGEGGMGRVFEAIHDQIQRRAAIKVLHSQFAHNKEAVSRFLNEARAVNIIQHPGVVNVFEFGELADGSPYIVMEFLEGESLSKRLERSGPLGLSGLRIARQIASALLAAHAKGIVHRDLKPANVMLVPDPDMPGGERAKVVDFGIAKMRVEGDPGQFKTRSGAILGTPAYMAPEQCRGAGEVDQRADVYALGVMIYEMLAGRPPFVAEGEGAVMGMHMFQAPPALRELSPSTPLDLANLVHGMLAKDPGYRPDMTTVAKELDRIGSKISGQMLAAQLPEQFLQAAAAIPDGNPEVPPVPGAAKTATTGSNGGAPPSLPPAISTTKVSTGTAGSRRLPWLAGGLAMVVLGGAIAGVVSWSRRAPHSQATPPRVSADLGTSVERPAKLTQVPLSREIVDAGAWDAAAPAIKLPTPADPAAVAHNPDSRVVAKTPVPDQPKHPGTEVTPPGNPAQPSNPAQPGKHGGKPGKHGGKPGKIIIF